MRKKNGELRFCLDLRKLNEIVDIDGHRVSNITEIVRALHVERFFSIIDLSDAYFKVRIEEGKA